VCLSKRCGAGEHDDGLLDLGPVDALDVERGGDEFLQGRGAWASSSTDDLGKDWLS
jgi:hypothetical protein